MSHRDPILMPLFGWTALLAACAMPPGQEAPVPGSVAGAAPAAPAAAPAATPTPAPAAAATPTPKPTPVPTPTPKIDEAKARALAAAEGINNPFYVVLRAGDHHEKLHGVKNANSVWTLLKDGRWVCLDSETGKIVDKR